MMESADIDSLLVQLEKAIDDSDLLADELVDLVDLPLCNDTPRVVVAGVACSLSLEHWNSVRLLLSAGLVASALALHRSQFESILRSVWLTFAATDPEVVKLTTNLDVDSESAARKIPQAKDMLASLSISGPKEAHSALSRFKDHSWNALNSYVHAGIHPLIRHANGYPAGLTHAVLRNANGLAVLSGMHAVVLAGQQPLQRDVLALAEKYLNCMPPKL